MTTWIHYITVYHRTALGSSVKWDRHVYDNCFWSERGSISSNGGERLRMATKSTRIRGKAEISIGDIVAYGIVNDSIDERTAGHRSTDFKKAHPDSFIVSNVHGNAIPGMPLQHTYAEGA